MSSPRHDVTGTKETDRIRNKDAQKTAIDEGVQCRSARYPAAYIDGDVLSPHLPPETVWHRRRRGKTRGRNDVQRGGLGTTQTGTIAVYSYGTKQTNKLRGP
jgi:hypothetical protein